MLYKFLIELSDVDRAVYETLEFRIAQHPSEIAMYLLCRVFAYALSYEEGLEFSGTGLADPEAAALKVVTANGAVKLWIEIGNPSAKKLHKASKVAKKVVVYTYKSADVLIADIKSNNVHRAEEIEIYQIDSKFLQSLENCLDKNNKWSILHQQGQVDITLGSQSFVTEIKKMSVK